jgi:hypothetical protein
MAEPVRIIGHNKGAVLNEQLQAQVSLNGGLYVDQQGFVLVDVDLSSPNYYGFIDSSGSYSIVKVDMSTGSTRFTSDTSGYLLAWTNRESLSYTLPSGRIPSIPSMIASSNFCLEASRGNVPGISVVNKFGHAPSGVQTTPTDIWSRSDAAATQPVWLAPTAPRIHQIASTSDLDGKTAAPNSVGARTIRIYGLKTWDTAESSEDIVLNGTTSVPTVNSYVIIHRMKVLTMGASGPNVGVISATADVNSTITAVIGVLEGQTEMAIYGVPSTHTFYMTRWSCSIGKSATTQSVGFELRVNESPHIQTTGFLLKNDMELITTGTSSQDKVFANYVKYAGPCIIKTLGIASANDIEAASAFDGYLVTN